MIENKPGGNTAIAASETARAPADGYTMLSADNGTLVFNPALYKKLSYDPAKDLAPVTLMGRFPMILVVGPAMKVNSAKEFLAEAKARKEGLDYASAGAGSPHHLAMELLKVEAGLTMTHVPYRGASPALADVAGGQVPAMMVDLAAGAGFINGGKVKALAVANPTRLPQLPDVPTFAELGYPKMNASFWYGMFAPAGTPQPIIERLNHEIGAALRADDIRNRLISDGLAVEPGTPQSLGATITRDSQLWGPVIKALGIELD